MTCKEAPALNLGTTHEFYVLNSEAYSSTKAPLSGLLKYKQTQEVDANDELVTIIDDEVSAINVDPKQVSEMESVMSVPDAYRLHYEAKIYKAREEGLAEGEAAGKAEGEALMSRLTDWLLDANRLDDLRRSTKDADFSAKLIQEMNG